MEFESASRLLPSWLPSFFSVRCPGAGKKFTNALPENIGSAATVWGGVCSERMRRSTAPSLPTMRTNWAQWILWMTWLQSWKVVLWFLCSKAHVLNRQRLLLERYQKPSALNHGCSQRKPVVSIKKFSFIFCLNFQVWLSNSCCIFENHQELSFMFWQFW